DTPLIVPQVFGVCLAFAAFIAFWWVLEARSHQRSKRIGARATGWYSTVTNTSRPHPAQPAVPAEVAHQVSR
ncbi:MAG: hypothetical protein ABI307_05800, partial [Mycobacterium sp.]